MLPFGGLKKKKKKKAPYGIGLSGVDFALRLKALSETIFSFLTWFSPGAGLDTSFLGPEDAVLIRVQPLSYLRRTHTNAALSHCQDAQFVPERDRLLCSGDMGTGLVGHCLRHSSLWTCFFVPKQPTAVVLSALYWI